MNQSTLISLSIGELTRNTWEPVLEEAVSALRSGYTHYSPVNGIFELRKAIADHYSVNQAEMGPENVLITPGVRQAVHNVLNHLIKPGDEVILPYPHWFAFPELIKQQGGVIVPFHTSHENDYYLDPQELAKLITPKTKLFIFNNPCNPTGKIYISREVEALMQVLEPHAGIHILSDEIYEFINYGYDFAPLSQWQNLADRVITVGGFSKTFAMAGWRIGYILAAEKFIQEFLRYQEVSLSGIPVFTQKAALKAFHTRNEYLPQLIFELEAKKKVAMEWVKSVTGLPCYEPEGAYYLFPNVAYYFGASSPKGRYINSANDLAAYLFAECKVQVFSGSMFGNGDHIRLSFSMDDDILNEGLERISKGLKALIH